MARPPYRWDQTNPSQKALQQGKRPYSGTLGQFPEAEAEDKRDNMWRARLLDNPKASGFSSRAQFDDDTAAQSYNKLYDLSLTPYSSFEDPRVRNQADRFLNAYAVGVGRIIDPKTAVLPEDISRRFGIGPFDYSIQDTNAGNAGIFPSRGPGVA